MFHQWDRYQYRYGFQYRYWYLSLSRISIVPIPALLFVKIPGIGTILIPIPASVSMAEQYRYLYESSAWYWYECWMFSLISVEHYPESYFTICMPRYYSLYGKNLKLNCVNQFFSQTQLKPSLAVSRLRLGCDKTEKVMQLQHLLWRFTKELKII